MLSVRTNTCVGICTYKCDFCIFVTYKLGTLTRSKIAHLESSNILHVRWISVRWLLKVLCVAREYWCSDSYTCSCNNNKLCRRAPQYATPPASWHFDLESGVRVTWGVGYLCANFSLPRPLCSQRTPDVRDRQMSVRQTLDTHHHLMSPPYGGGGMMMLVISTLLFVCSMLQYTVTWLCAITGASRISCNIADNVCLVNVYIIIIIMIMIIIFFQS